MGTLFISDLHLDERRPDTIELTHSLIRDYAPQFDALYILGDFVEYWIGDDYCHPAIRSVFASLSALNKKGTRVYLMHGNRDFLISTKFATQFDIELIEADEIRIDLHGQPALLMHGDTLCTDDEDYQHFRALVRSAEWQTEFLAKSIDERLAVVESLRDASKQAAKEKSPTIMDVNQLTLEYRMQQHDVELLIHGHTHRPAKHQFELGQANATRYVLGEWKAQADVLACTERGQTLVSWPLNNSSFTN